jgi:hypothetical protein
MPLSRPAKLAAALSLTGLAAPATAQPERARDDGAVVIIRVPQFTVQAVSFTADEETGGGPGSDEVHGVLIDFLALKERVTSEYENVDAGDTIAFRSGDRCIATQPDCQTGADRVHFGIALWEKDWSWNLFLPTCVLAPNSRANFDRGICAEDDLIGRIELGFSRLQLLGTLPNIGDAVERQVQLRGGDGTYRVNYRITRLADARKRIPRPPRRPEGIVLGAVIDAPPPGRISLTWSGATAASVDVLRGAALVATTPNDGQHHDRVQSGTYQYRVCNAGTTSCSNTVSITVP